MYAFSTDGSGAGVDALQSFLKGGIMNLSEKKQFITEWSNSIRDTLLLRVHRVPKEWNGMELRWWLCEAYFEQAIPNRIQKEQRTRYRNFKKEVLVSNL